VPDTSGSQHQVGNFSRCRSYLVVGTGTVALAGCQTRSLVSTQRLTLSLQKSESAGCRPWVISETYGCRENLLKGPSLRETCLLSPLSPQTKLSVLAYLLSASDLGEVGSLGLSDLQTVLRYPRLLSAGDLSEVDMLARLTNGMLMSLMHRILACPSVLASMRHHV
jgi:hypothetical protein